jgi:hypothetical protein
VRFFRAAAHCHLHYTEYKSFTGNNVKDTTVYFNKLVKSDKQVVFDMEVSNVGLRRFSDVREDQRAGLSRLMKDVLHAADGGRM